MSTFPTKHNISMAPLNPSGNTIRISLLVMVVLSLLLSTAFATVGILVMKRIDHFLTDLQRLAIYAHIIIYLFYGAVCLFGLGAISLKKTKQTSFFMAFVVGQILFSLSAGILGLYFLYNPAASRAWNTANCSTTSDSFRMTLCRNSSLMKGIATTLIVVTWLVEFVTVFLGNAFLNQLYEEDMRIEMLDPKYYDGDARNC